VSDFSQDIAYFRFDTSSLPDTAVVSGATLKLYINSKGTSVDNMSVVGDYYDFGGEPVVTGDYIQTASPSIITPVSINGVATGVVVDFVFTDFTGISLTGITGIRLTCSAGTPTSGNDNYIEIAQREHATLQEPQFDVVWALVDATLVQVPMAASMSYVG
jgi:hypothetical protein